MGNRNSVIDYIEQNYDSIEKDMNCRIALPKTNWLIIRITKRERSVKNYPFQRQEALSAEKVEIVVKFD